MKRRTIGWAGWVGVVLGMLLPLSASACLWDTDTLANEAKGLPDVIQVITGRFERNPPLFYTMRLQRVTTELAKEPGILNDYDDAGVACDRLSRDGEALVWMRKKRALLEKADSKAPETKEQWYRYYANVGTFRVHRWLRAGADRKRIAEVEQARKEIAKAIDINPDAHFGRERVQLALMDWIIAPKRKWSSPVHEIRDELPDGYDREKIRKGICGLIVLGNAWESVDCFLFLAERGIVHEQTVEYLAGLRIQELVQQGHHSLHQEEFPDAQVLALAIGGHKGLVGKIHEEVEEQYRQLRAEADAWQKRRTDYMLARLQSGRHPDTDPTFWKDWKETPPPSLEVSWRRYAASRFGNPVFWSQHIELILLAVVVLIVLWWVENRLRRRKAALAANNRTHG